MLIPVLRVSLAALLVCSFAWATPFEVKVIDSKNGWPVPMVRLKTTHNVTFVTDNAGVVAIDLPELMDREVWLSVQSDGYELPPDGFGNRGIRVKPIAGGSHEIKIARTIIAKRLGRLTGAGFFPKARSWDSISIGRKAESSAATASRRPGIGAKNFGLGETPRSPAIPSVFST